MAEQPIIAFSSAVVLRRWLTKNHTEHPGIWMQIAKKDSGIASVTYAEALDEALCFGWIDGQRKSLDETAYMQKFTKRGTRSLWSKINVGHIDRLTHVGRMQPSGQAAVDAAKADGRWERAYHSASKAELPADFLAALSKHKKAQEFLAMLSKTNHYAIYFRIATAKKPETRATRIADFVAMLNRGEKLH